MTPQYSRFRLLIVLWLAAALLLCGSSLAGAEQARGWEKVKDSFVHAGRQTGAFLREMHRSFLHFFRKDVKEAAKEMGKGAVQTGKETNKTLKESGKETAKSLKGAAQKTKTNLRRMGKGIKEGFKETK
jgi:hypothetical protein